MLFGRQDALPFRTPDETIVITLPIDRSTESAGDLTGVKMKENEDFELNSEEREELVREIRDLYRILVPDLHSEEDK